MHRPILKLPAKPKSSARARNIFRAWVISELNKRGAQLPGDPTYAELRAHIERFGLGGRRVP